MKRQSILGLVGPTASGKSALALKAAQALHGEIVCMDSMQVYRGMDIGTAKPAPEEQALVPHHLLDIVEPGRPFSAAEYKERAGAAIEGILSQDRLPLLCGGTGLYLRALSRGMDFGSTPGDPAVRAGYFLLAQEKGNEAVHAILQAKDPLSAARLHPNNLRRVVRALEVLEVTGQPFSAQQMLKDSDGPYDLRLFALSWPRETLYQRINERVAAMLEAGLLGEVRALLEAGVPTDAQSMQGLGYKELVPVAQGEIPLADAAELLSRRTRNYAKRQLTWFRADQRITWLNCADGIEKNLQIIISEMSKT